MLWWSSRRCTNNRFESWSLSHLIVAETATVTATVYCLRAQMLWWSSRRCTNNWFESWSLSHKIVAETTTVTATNIATADQSPANMFMSQFRNQMMHSQSRSKNQSLLRKWSIRRGVYLAHLPQRTATDTISANLTVNPTLIHTPMIQVLNQIIPICL